MPGFGADAGRQKVPGRRIEGAEMVVMGVSRAPPSAVPVKRGPAGRGFGIRSEASVQSEPATEVSGVAMTSLLAMQEVESDAIQDREARRHGEAMLTELAELQRGLLGADGADLVRLAKLVERPVLASDPVLAGLLRAVRLRAGIELARRSLAASM